jgi:hypothetical protein
VVSQPHEPRFGYMVATRGYSSSSVLLLMVRSGTTRGVCETSHLWAWPYLLTRSQEVPRLLRSRPVATWERVRIVSLLQQCLSQL